MITCCGEAWPLWRTTSTIRKGRCWFSIPSVGSAPAWWKWTWTKGWNSLTWSPTSTVPYEVLSTGPAYRHVRFLAQDVPSVGYKAYALKGTKAEPAAPQASIEGTFENQYYRVVLDRRQRCGEEHLRQGTEQGTGERLEPLSLRSVSLRHGGGSNSQPAGSVQFRLAGPGALQSTAPAAGGWCP